MIEGSACAAVRATPGEVIAFVLDLDRYRLADTKIASARFVAGDSVGGTVVIKGRLRGLPTPPDRQHYTVSADGNTVEFRSAPSRWPGLLATFHGVVRCHPLPDGGTCVTHTERFAFTPPLASLLDPYLRSGYGATPRKKSPGWPHNSGRQQGPRHAAHHSADRSTSCPRRAVMTSRRRVHLASATVAEGAVLASQARFRRRGRRSQTCPASSCSAPVTRTRSSRPQKRPVPVTLSAPCTAVAHGRTGFAFFRRRPDGTLDEADLTHG